MKYILKHSWEIRRLKHGEWGGDKHIRFIQPQVVYWNDALVHEQLIKPGEIVVKKLKGYVCIRTMKDLKDYRT
jgi:hypothetical protein